MTGSRGRLTFPRPGCSSFARDRCPGVSPAPYRSPRRAASYRYRREAGPPGGIRPGMESSAEGSSAVRFDEADRILHRHDLFGCVIRDLAPELLLEGHHQLDGVEAVGAQIVDEAGVFGHLRFVDAQMLDDDLFDPIGDVTHPFFSSSGFSEIVTHRAPGAICRRR